MIITIKSQWTRCKWALTILLHLYDISKEDTYIESEVSVSEVWRNGVEMANVDENGVHIGVMKCFEIRE